MQLRPKNMMRNALTSALVVIVNTLLQFANRTVFISELGKHALGYNGLFTSTLSMLSIADFGIGAAIIYSLYEPMAKHDVGLLSSLMQLYRKIYHVIAFIVAVFGIIAFIFINPQITGTQTEILQLRVVYFLFLANSVSGYLLSYRRSLFDADQKAYKNQINYLIFNTASSILQMGSLLIFHDYVIYSLIAVLFTIGANFKISRDSFTEYSYLNNTSSKIPSKTIKSLKRLTIGNFSNKIGTIVVYSTDNILIASFVGITQVGLYSNYALIVSTLESLVTRVFSSLTATIGYTKFDKSDDAYATFKNLHFLSTAISLFISSGIWMCVQPFIRLWLGNQYVLSTGIIAIATVNLGIDLFRKTSLTFIDAYGLAWTQRWKSLIEAVVNLGASLFFVLFMHWGIFGILFGTTVSNILVVLWYEPFIVYKEGLHKSFTAYLYVVARSVVAIAINFGIIVPIWNLTDCQGLVGIIVAGLVSLSASCVALVIAYWNTAEFSVTSKMIRKNLRWVRHE